MTGNEKRGDAKTDVALEKFKRLDSEIDRSITKLEVRADMKSAGEEENSAVIDQRTLEAQRKKESEMPPGNGYSQQAVLLVRSVRGWPQALVGLGILILIGWICWLKFR